ncbi:putative reverse transcriptase domain-containing protein [Tanacetum coccineum]
MEFKSAKSNTTAKLPILKLVEYKMWVIRIKQYFQIQDYALWEVIENGNSWVSLPQTAQENDTSVMKMSVPVTAEEKTNKKNDVRARSLLLLALPNEHKLTFSQYPNAKIMFAGAVSMANRLTTDGIKDGLFKKTENAGNKRRSWITSRIVVKHPSVQNAILYLVTAQGLIEPLPREEIANPMLAIEGNTNQGNSRNQAQGRAFCLGVAEAPQDPNIVTGTFSLNDHFAIVLFDSGADYSFISTKFLPLINMKPSVISRYGSFDVVVGMIWLSKMRDKIVCYEKIVQIPLSNRDILEVHKEHPKGNLKQLKTMKVNEPKLEDIPIVHEFPGVFPKDLSGLPPSRKVEFCIDLIPGAMPVAKSPYRLAPTEMQELSYQLKEIQESLHTPSSSP